MNALGESEPGQWFLEPGRFTSAYIYLSSFKNFPLPCSVFGRGVRSSPPSLREAYPLRADDGWGSRESFLQTKPEILIFDRPDSNPEVVINLLRGHTRSHAAQKFQSEGAAYLGLHGSCRSQENGRDGVRREISPEPSYRCNSAWEPLFSA
jgi:hypothetical protein